MFTYTDSIYRYRRIDAQIQAELYDKRNTFECCIVSVVDKDIVIMKNYFLCIKRKSAHTL